jgi:hypothetical protein
MEVLLSTATVGDGPFVHQILSRFSSYMKYKITKSLSISKISICLISHNEPKIYYKHLTNMENTRGNDERKNPVGINDLCLFPLSSQAYYEKVM